MSATDARIRMMASRAILRTVDDTQLAQSVQLDMLEDETQDEVERLQNYGFGSNPHPDAEVVVLCPSGLRSHAIAIVIEDRRYRLKELEPGEVAMFDDLGNLVKLGREKIEVVAVGDMSIDVAGDLTANVEGKADVTIGGNLTASVGGNLSATIDGSADITAQTVHLTASGGATIDANVRINGNIDLHGKLDATGDVTGQGTSLHNHKHAGVTTGSGQTGAPV